MPVLLMGLKRHESIETTMKYIRRRAGGDDRERTPADGRYRARRQSGRHLAFSDVRQFSVTDFCETLYEGWITGFEPATSGTTIQRSNQLSYIHQIVGGV